MERSRKFYEGVLGMSGEAEELKSLGVELETIPDGEMKTDERGIADMPGVSIAWIRDPDGQVLSFFQPTA